MNKPRIRVRNNTETNCVTVIHPNKPFSSQVFHKTEIAKSAGYLELLEAKRKNWLRSGENILIKNADKLRDLIQVC